MEQPPPLTLILDLSRFASKKVGLGKWRECQGLNHEITDREKLEVTQGSFRNHLKLYDKVVVTVVFTLCVALHFHHIPLSFLSIFSMYFNVMYQQKKIFYTNSLKVLG